MLKSSGILYYLPYLVFALLFWWADPFPGSALLSLLILGMGVWGRIWFTKRNCFCSCGRSWGSPCEAGPNKF